MNYEIKNLTLVKSDVTILDHLSAIIPSKKLTAILGPNGAGKSTLLRAMVQLETPVTGELILDEKTNLNSLDRLELSKRIAWVPDSIYIPFSFSVIETVILGRYPWHLGHPKKKDFERADESLELLGIDHLRDRSINSLSAGEQKKSYLARAFAGDADFVILDEPLANLDISSALKLSKILQSLTASGKTICITFHDLNFAKRFSDWSIIMARGSVIANGKTAEVLNSENIDKVFGINALTLNEGDLETFVFDLP